MMNTSFKTLVLALAGLGSLHAQAQTATPEAAGIAMMRLNASMLDRPAAPSASGSIWGRLRNSFRLNEVNPELVRRHEIKFTTGSAYFNRTIERSRPYLYYISSEVARRNMPAEIALLPFIESAFVSKARSHVGASGLWQFMPATGRHYGLEQTPLYDGRHDIYASTHAALNYLEYLYSLFGDWSLALAAYNWGEGNVGRAIARARAQGLEPTYENLRMPDETRNYVPKLLAVRNIVNNPQYFGMSFTEIDNRPYFQAFNIDHPIDISAAARLAQISESEFLALNPAFKAPVYIPKSGRKMLLPTHAAAVFEQNYRKADKASLVSWDVYTPYTNTTLTSIAAETGMSEAQLRSLNGMRTNNVPAGRSILVSKSSFAGGTPPAAASFAGLDVDTNPNDNKLQDVPDFGRPPQASGQNIPFPQASSAYVRPASVSMAGWNNTAQQQAAAQQALEQQRAQQAAQQALEQQRAQQAAQQARQQTAQVSQMPDTTAPADILQQQAQDYLSSTRSADTAPTVNAPDALAQLAQAGNSAVGQTGTSSLNAAEEEAMRQRMAAEMQAHDQAEAQRRAAAEQAARRAAAEQKAREAEQARQAKAAADARARQQAQAKAATHRVSSGDTLYSIAQRYNISVGDLTAANGIKGNSIRPGQVLKVGGIKAAAAQAESRQTKADKGKADAKEGKAKGKVKTVSYTVRSGDTLIGIAKRFGVEVGDIQGAKGPLKPGQTLKVQQSR